MGQDHVRTLFTLADGVFDHFESFFIFQVCQRRKGRSKVAKAGEKAYGSLILKLQKIIPFVFMKLPL